MSHMHLHLDSILLWGFVATLVLTTILSASQHLRQTRMSMPLVLGTLVSGDLDRAERYGFALHFLSGWLFSLVYGLVFESLGRATWWIGAALGLVHGLFILAVLLPTLPSLHPRMASEHRQPEPTALLEPPGFMGLHYGVRTPLVTLSAHIIYGAILGGFYGLT